MNKQENQTSEMPAVRAVNKIANRQVICDVLMERAKEDKDIVVLCSDSRGSASMTPFADTYPEQFVETGIAEQNLVSISAGMAKAGKKPYAASPACFLSTRSYEQAKVDVAYSNTNVKLIGISGGISYGALGMSHHSAQDFAAMCAIPGMRVYVPSDRHQTKKLMESLVEDTKPAYIRVGRNPVQDVYEEENVPFEMDKATIAYKSGVMQGKREAAETEKPVVEGVEMKAVAAKTAVIIACGEMVRPSKAAASILEEQGIAVTVIDMYCLKPLDEATIINAARNADVVVTAEEHAPFGGLGSMVSQVLGQNCPRKMAVLALPDAPVITGTSQEVFDYYGLNAEGIAERTLKLFKTEEI